MNKRKLLHQLTQKTVVYLLILRVLGGAWGAPEAKAFIHTQSSTSLLNLDQPVSGLIHLSTENYISRPSDASMIYWPYFEAAGSWMLSGETIRSVGQGKIFLPFASKEPSFEFSEAYVGTPADIKPFQLFVGRKFEAWSELDEYWKLGMWEPRFRMNYLEPSKAALLGGFLKYESKHFSVTHFISPFFIPDRGVPTQICDGMVCSSSPWFLPPSHKIQIMNIDTPLQYQLDLPSVGEVVTHPGTSLVMHAHREDLWASVAYAYKPVNQLLLAYDASLTTPSPVPVVPVNIHPRVLYHHIAAIDAGIKNKKWNFSLSSIAEWPLQDSTPEEWVTQEIQNTVLVSPKIQYSLSEAQDSLLFDMSYLKQWGGEAPGKNPFEINNKNDRIFEPRNSFNSAIQAGVSFPLSLMMGREMRLFSFSYRLLYDFSHPGSIISVELGFHPKHNLHFDLGGDFLSSYTSDGQSGLGNDFISRYQSNDRVHFGVTYVF